MRDEKKRGVKEAGWGRLVAGPIVSDEIGTTSFKPHDLILGCKGLDSFSHSGGPTEVFFSD